MDHTTLSEIETIGKEIIKLLGNIYEEKSDEYRKVAIEGDLHKAMHDFHVLLDSRTKDLLGEYFESFKWMDHWNLETIGKKEPEIFIVANTSDGTESTMKGMIGGHVSAIAFLPSESITMGETFFSIVKNYDTDHYIFANSKGKVHMDGFVKFKDIKTLKDASVSVEFGDKTEREFVFNKLNKILVKANKIGKKGCFSLNVIYTALGCIQAHVDVRSDCSDISHFPAPYLILKNLNGIVTDINGKNMVKYPLHSREQIPYVVSSNKEIHNQILNNL